MTVKTAHPFGWLLSRQAQYIYKSVKPEQVILHKVLGTPVVDKKIENSFLGI